MPQNPFFKIHPICFDKNSEGIIPFTIFFFVQTLAVGWFFFFEYYRILERFEPKFTLLFTLSFLGTLLFLFMLFISILLELELFKYNFFMVLLAFSSLFQAVSALAIITKTSKHIRNKTERTYVNDIIIIMLVTGISISVYSFITLINCYNNSEIEK